MRRWACLVALAGAISSMAQTIEPATDRSVRLLIIRWAARDMQFTKTQLDLVDRARTRPTEDFKADSEVARSVEKTLTEGQRRRWRQLSLQYSGLAAASVPSVAKELVLGRSQAQEIARLTATAWKEMQAHAARLNLPPLPESPSDPQAANTKRVRRYVIECLRAKHLDLLDKRLASVLRKEQRTAWQKMLGPINDDVRLTVPASPVPNYPDYRLLSEKTVQADLGLSQKTITRVSAVLKRSALLLDLNDLGPEALSAQILRLQKLTERHLTAAQLSRLREITVQVYGYDIARSHAFATRIGMSATQERSLRVQLGRVLRDLRVEDFEHLKQAALPFPGQTMARVGAAPQSGTDFLASRERILAGQRANDLRSQRVQKTIMAALSAQQKSQLAKLSGRPIAGLDRLQSLYSPL